MVYPELSERHFLNYCPKHCPCGYHCGQAIDDNGLWQIPPSKATMKFSATMGVGIKHIKYEG